jgi:hypothetical protein
MDSCSDSIKEALIGIGREVHDDFRSGSNSTGYLDVEHDFTVWTVRVTGWEIVAMLNRTGDDFRLRNSDLSKVIFEVFRAKSSSELNDADALAGSVALSREIVEFGYLVGKVRNTPSGVWLCYWLVSLTPIGKPTTKVGASCRTVVETEDILHYIL